MGFLWDWSKIIIVTITILGLVLNGYLSPVAAAVFMMLYVMFRGAVRGSEGITRVIFWVFEIGFVMLLFINVLAEGGDTVNLIPKLIGLFWEAVAWVFELLLEGRLTIYHGIIFILAVIIFKSIGKWIGSIAVHRTAQKAFLIGVPIAMLFVFINIQGDGNLFAVLGHLLPLLLLLFGFYLLLFGWSSSHRRP